jgi:Uma2 family endonuclease
VPPLENGDRLDQETFHERYQAMPEHVKAELIGGIVYMASPQKLPHGRGNKDLLWWLGVYEDHTPGVEALSGVTNILSASSEPEPNACLFVMAEYGGRAGPNEDDYLAGAPDWVGEIAASTESIDLHRKKLDYEKAGVREYVVVALWTEKVFWFVLRRGKFQEMKPDADGIYRAKVFPGLWLDPDALLRRDRKRVLAVLREGLATKEHEAFVAKLAARKRLRG